MSLTIVFGRVHRDFKVRSPHEYPFHLQLESGAKLYFTAACYGAETKNLSRDEVESSFSKWLERELKGEILPQAETLHAAFMAEFLKIFGRVCSYMTGSPPIIVIANEGSRIHLTIEYHTGFIYSTLPPELPATAFDYRDPSGRIMSYCCDDPDVQLHLTDHHEHLRKACELVINVMAVNNLYNAIRAGFR
jgi:hypothetical protein